MMTRWLARLTLVSAFALSIATAIGAWRLGRGALGAPPVRSTSYTKLAEWARQRTPLEIGMGVVRVALLLIATALALMIAIAIIDGILLGTRQTSTRKRPLFILPMWLRQWRDAAFAASLTAALTVATVGGAGASDRPTVSGVARPAATAVLRHAGDPASGQRWPNFDGRSPSPRTEVKRSASGTASSVVAATTVATTAPPNPARPAASSEVSPRDTSIVPQPDTLEIASAPSEAPNEAPSITSAPPTRVVRAGESFWSIAEDVVLNDSPHADEPAIARYWRRLVDANMSSLRAPRDPDRLYPGDTIRLPSPS